MQEIKITTKEQKEELVKMDWREVIIKRKQLKDRSRQKPQTRMAGGKKPSQTNDQYLQYRSNRHDSDLDDSEDASFERKELANATREDLIDKVMDLIGQMSDEEMIDLLIGSQGQIDIGSIQVRDNR